MQNDPGAVPWGRVCAGAIWGKRHHSLGSNVRCEPITSRFPTLSRFAHFSKFATSRIRIRAGLTEADIATAPGYAERRAQVLARYDRKSNG
jgi:hypothetical protein